MKIPALPTRRAWTRLPRSGSLRMLILSALAIFLALPPFLGWSGQPKIAKEEDPSKPLPWAFQPIAKPAPPEAGENAAWVRNPIDRFILSKQRAAHLKPSPQAARRAIIRRLSLDLVGLPPSPAEVTRFVNDSADDAYEQLVDRLLNSESYGERQARLWLDLVRYADSDGYKADVFRPNAWRYRDYIIRSFNADKNYDRFIHEQLAGDELFPDDADALMATGFLRQWPYEDNQIDVRRQWQAILEDITEVTGEVFMATGLRCAKCHDHKFDPIPQKDYYRMQSFFAGIVPRDDTSLNPPPVLAAFEKENAGWKKISSTITDQIEALSQPAMRAREREVYKKFPDYLKAIWDKPDDQRTPLERQLKHLADYQVGNKGGDLKHDKDIAIALKGLEGTLKVLEGHTPKPAPLPLIDGVSDLGPEAPMVRIPGNESMKPIAPGLLSVLDPSDAKIPRLQANPNSSGRRAALARWLTNKDNPLTSRVMVNRIWQQHFGHGLVRTPNDFGKQGEQPSHPALLDWLARHFMEEQQWSLKKLHRLIVTSATYRQSSTRSKLALERDPENRLLSGAPIRRLDAEQLRDAMLSVSGELRISPIGGKAVPDDFPRRSVYVKNIRNHQSEILKTFDAADMFNSCADRKTTTTPLQSLLLMNGPWTSKRAKAFAGSVLEASGDDMTKAIQLAFQRAFGRKGTAKETSSAASFIESLDEQDPARALSDLCHVLLNTNEFLFVD